MVDQVRLRYQNQFKNTGDMANFRKIKGIARLLKTKEINQQKYWERATTKISSGSAMPLHLSRICWRLTMPCSSSTRF